MIRSLVLGAAALGFAGLAAVFGATAVDLWSPAPPQTRAAPKPQPQAPAPAAPARFSPPALDDFADLIDRPLFEPDRHPPEIYVEEEPEEMEEEVDPLPPLIDEEEPFDAYLRGVVTTSSGGFVLLEPGDGGPMVRLSLGEIHRGWRLERLNERGAVFRKEEEEISLSLSYRDGG